VTEYDDFGNDVTEEQPSFLQYSSGMSDLMGKTSQFMGSSLLRSEPWFRYKKHKKHISPSWCIIICPKHL
jgi:hypothetical protein